MNRITKKSLWIDLNQGETRSGQAFGFVWTKAMDAYQGWFFNWPSSNVSVSTVEDRDAVIASLNADETQPNEPQIPYRWARQKLEKILKKKFDLR